MSVRPYLYPAHLDIWKKTLYNISHIYIYDIFEDQVNTLSFNQGVFWKFVIVKEVLMVVKLHVC